MKLNLFLIATVLCWAALGSNAALSCINVQTAHGERCIIHEDSWGSYVISLFP